ncbi:uncharacterized protein E0L32_009117 [Thyridium curvatum]|uniref:Uncharacterized protein n=1 Tax=Thyridium curvatum TaxID=1093900 RepID=A0A507AT18_9PEZI|nr:uncharacterized protein E0L32_009117 [Thyridium curvatum]TPX09644.1 hypothetical protein E0L32_009117 [Thyridium curvatum]
MPEAIDDLLKTGHWSTSRAKSPQRLSPSSFDNPPIRPNQGVKLGPHVPRSFAFDSCDFPKRSRPPIVEDETASLEREYSATAKPSSFPEEEAKFPGDIDQQPIFENVHENNPERRFVILQTDGDAPAAEVEQTPTGGSYSANTGRKVSNSRIDDNNGIPPPAEIKRRRSRLDLPRLDTEFQESSRPSSAHRERREKPEVHVDQPPRDRRDSSETHESADKFLSPSVIKHSTNGRYRAYQDFSRSPHESRTSVDRGNRVTSEDRRSSNRHDYDRRERLAPSTGPLGPRRSTSAIEVPQVSRRPSVKRRSRDELAESPRASRNSLHGGMSSSYDPRRSPPPPIERRASSPPHRSYGDRDKSSRRDSRHSRSPNTTRNSYDDSSDDDLSIHRPHRDRGTSFLNQDDRNYLLSPESALPPMRPRSGTLSSRQTTPLASPRVSQSYFPEMPNPRSSVTFSTPSKEKHEPRPVSPFSSASSSSRNGSRGSGDGHPKPRSRAPSFNAGAAAAGAAAIAMAAPAVLPSFPESPIERRHSPMPPPAHSRQGSGDKDSSKIPWQPPAFNPLDSGVSLDKPIVSYRRYSEDVHEGNVADMPTCPRMAPEAGRHDWLTISRCDSFNVCPTCYHAVFVSTPYQHQLVPAPFRAVDKPIACDLGTSLWYRIAWLMTKKYNVPDLRYLKGIADVTAKYPQCPLNDRTTWHTVIDPRTNKPVPDLRVCPGCTKSVEMLFPNLTGVLRPMAGPDPDYRSCSLHFTPQMDKFVEYFDVLESASDKAVESKTTIDVGQLAKRLKQIAIPHKCPGDHPVESRKWYLLTSMPRFTVCEECYHEVIYPEMYAYPPGAIKFTPAPQVLPKAECKLYSSRMRDVFKRAYRKDDLSLLEGKFFEREAKEMDIFKRLDRLDKAPPSSARSKEVKRLLEEWKRCE